MKIYRKLLDDILNSMPLKPPEVGGIIGGKEGKVCVWKFDRGNAERGCIYVPNVSYINSVIDVWIENDYDFMGILHVHYGGSKFLSDGDKKYIETIMKSMPSVVKQLYFPIVVQPERKLVSYKAIKNSQDEIIILFDEVKIIND